MQEVWDLSWDVENGKKGDMARKGMEGGLSVA